MTDKQSPFHKLKDHTWIFLVVFALWALTPIVVSQLYPCLEHRGQIGDLFGSVNALFSGLALAGVIITILLQQGEIARTAGQVDKQTQLFQSQRELEAWSQAQKAFDEERFFEARALLFQRLRSKKKTWNKKERDAAGFVSRKMNQLAHLHPFLGNQLMLAAWDDPLAKLWYILQDYVQDERKQTNWPTKWKAFEDLGKLAIEKLQKEGRSLDSH